MYVITQITTLFFDPSIYNRIPLKLRIYGATEMCFLLLLPGLWSQSRHLGLETYEPLVSRKTVNVLVSSWSRPFTSRAQYQLSAKFFRPH